MGSILSILFQGQLNIGPGSIFRGVQICAFVSMFSLLPQ